MMSYQGFTLIELLIVLAIIAILASIGYPLYIHHLTRVRRKQAQILLYQVANQLEEFHALEGNYKEIFPENLSLEKWGDLNQYQIRIDHLSEQHFRISAVPQGNQAKSDQVCGILSLDENGKRYISGNGTHQHCWNN